ncbi:Isochorismate hydrolase [Fervidobacterium changbaicum]|uniref:Cysteine hydrolase n=1 Tax=Fervidobacterium changbaicum TaxID=310769 RepID=A0ABX5QUD8_9BACT|nr:isochorismatase family protein [Fervidobacterium changbaicum]QAV32291.1 cysteine hydrolase [Fervidobacterium changbaicum]QAV34055.1 cysteine hydrolase [Fervidobacterium changbaicum]SDH38782.1 Isochorismate hydrolase [Fervidobacterium changbaicum]
MFYLEKTKHPLTISSPAVLIVDVQNYFFDKNSPAYLRGSESVLERIKNFIESIRAINKSLPIIATIHKNGSNNMKKWWGNIVEEQWTKLCIDERLIDFKIEKETYDAFYQTNLDELLKTHGINQLIITGVMTHLCCETTARSGFVRGYEIVMVEDCLWDKDEWYHYASLKNLAHGFSTISTSQEVVEKLKAF